MKLDDYRKLTLGALIRYPNFRTEYGSRLDVSMFLEPEEQFLAEKIKKSETLTDLAESCVPVGGLPFLKSYGRLVKRFGKITPRDLAQWIEKLDNNAKRETVSRLIDSAREELDELSGESKYDDIVDSLVSNLVSSTHNTRTSEGFKSLDSAADSVIAELVGLEQGIVKNRVPTGFENLDEFLGGGLPRNLVTLAGPPGVGKTTLALHFATNLSQLINKKVAKSRGNYNPGVIPFVSTEMPTEELLSVIAQYQAGITVEPNISKAELRKLVRQIDIARSYPVMVDDSDIMTTRTIYSRMESLFLTYGKIQEIVIDFAERVLDEGESNMEQQVGKVFIRAGILSRRYNCPVVLISHLSRDFEKSRSKVPGMNDIRYSRLAEATSYLIILPYYPYHYVATKKHIVPPPEMPATPGVNYLIVDKHRRGKTGPVAMGWEPEITRWSTAPKDGIYHVMGEDELFQRSLKNG